MCIFLNLLIYSFLDIEQRRELIASQDFIESILRRGAKGIEIKEFTLLTGEDER